MNCLNLCVLFSSFFILSKSSSLNFCAESVPYLRNYRIIGGWTANVSSLPFYVLLFSSNSNGFTEMCGGTILNERWILTAAHCLPNDLKRSTARIGVRSMNDFDQSVAIEKTVVHGGFSLETAEDDIALLKTRTPISFNNRVSAVCLTRDDTKITQSGRKAMAVGFGKSIERIPLGLRFNNGPSDELKTTIVPIQDTNQCSIEWWSASGGQTRISEGNICAGSLGHGTAPGDSGGPLLVRDDFGHIIQVGITSFGANGFEGIVDQKHFPGVYTRVSTYIPWILRRLEEDEPNFSHRKSCLIIFILLFFKFFY